MRRRNFLSTTVASAGALMAGLTAIGDAHAEQTPEGSVSIRTQETDGTTLRIEHLWANVDVLLHIEDPPSDNTYLQKDFPAGTDKEEFDVELDQPIETGTEVEAWLFTRPDNEVLFVDTALVSHEDDPEILGMTLVDADPEYGFNYPYFLYTPSFDTEEEVPLVVEPNNTGETTDDFDRHFDRAEALVTNGDGRDISEELDIPLLVPVFPRPASDPVDWSHYIHALDRETLTISDGPLERVDLQLLRMTDHAKEEMLDETAYSFTDQIMLNGFSASGNFVERFTLLHPDRVLSVTAGGLNGMTVLPIEEAEGQKLPFHVGIADVEEIIGESIDLEALDGTNQFLYMGAQDDNDTIPFDDAWTDDELRQLALDVYGDDMIEDRFPRCQEAYVEADITAQFRIYEEAGHTSRPARDDLIDFHRMSLSGEDVSGYGQDLSDFDSDSAPPDGGGDLDDDEGTPSPSEDEAPSTPADEEDSNADSPEEQPSDSGSQPFLAQINPTDFVMGFGVGTLFSGLVAGAYLLGRRSTSDDEEQH